MKRTEMLKIIETAIDKACGNDGAQRLYPSDDYLAYAVLNAVEKAGMLPPHSEVAERKLAKKYAGTPGYYSDGNNWEPEE